MAELEKSIRFKIGLPGDPAGPVAPEMPIPTNLNYDMWLGSTPEIPYTEIGVHPQKGYGRPGWLRQEQFGSGMITGWGQHHYDSAAWGMDTELTGPISVESIAEFPKSGSCGMYTEILWLKLNMQMVLLCTLVEVIPMV